MLVSELRTRVRHSLLKTDGGDWDNDQVDRGAMTLLQDFIMEVKPTVISGTVALTATSPSVDIQASFPRFLPERSIRFEAHKWDESATEPGHEVEHVDYNAVARMIRSGTVAATSGSPLSIGFRTPTSAFLDKTPGTVYPLLRVTYYDTLNEWQPGTAAEGTIAINIPDHYMTLPVWFGIAAVVQHQDPAAGYMNAAYLKYVEYRDRVKGKLTFDSGVVMVDESQYNSP